MSVKNETELITGIFALNYKTAKTGILIDFENVCYRYNQIYTPLRSDFNFYLVDLFFSHDIPSWLPKPFFEPANEQSNYLNDDLNFRNVYNENTPFDSDIKYAHRLDIFIWNRNRADDILLKGPLIYNLGADVKNFDLMPYFSNTILNPFSRINVRCPRWATSFSQRLIIYGSYKGTISFSYESGVKEINHFY